MHQYPTYLDAFLSQSTDEMASAALFFMSEDLVNNEVNHLFGLEPFAYTMTDFYRQQRNFGIMNDREDPGAAQDRLTAMFAGFRAFENIESSRMLGFNTVTMLDKLFALHAGRGLKLYESDDVDELQLQTGAGIPA